MIHVAIMKKSWGLVPRILSGEKTIESRWYQTRRAPWGKIFAGDTIYFKNSGEPVTVRATVEKVQEFKSLNFKKIKDILSKYGKDDGIAPEKIPEFVKLFANKKYCLLIYLKNPKRIKSFEINKKGFGMMSAWLTTKKIASLRSQ